MCCCGSGAARRTRCPSQLSLGSMAFQCLDQLEWCGHGRARLTQDAPSAEQRLIVDRAVLRSTVGMMNQPRRGVASHESAAQGFDREIALQAVTRGPADDAAREEVQDDGEVEPSHCRPDGGDVRPLLPVRAVRRKVLRHEVRGNWPGMFAVRRPLESPFLSRDQLVLAHQAGRAMSPDLMALVDEVCAS